MTKISTNLYSPSQAPRLTERELLNIFPEAKAVIPEKLKEREETEKEIKGVIRHNLKIVRNRVKDEFSRWFWREVVKMEIADEVLENNRQTQRLKRLFLFSKGKLPSPKMLTQEKIEQARLSPILEIAQSFLKLRKQGKNHTALCPFHQEKHPSFFIYPDSNSFYCFGCAKGGDVIKFVELYFEYSFKKAVEYLTRR
ncbi:MAG: CHC2 zinc finger domain-containing protein [Candidatus Ratteibacteria bacterium]|nr:CHC2 zinc finger domain-containing protein [Candidatus Ratteibacteria bacterium]